ncbi:Pentatricopeptide repeat [Phaffia rhodozyma]|uniref:Pentatricopeptide repeat n=1 Tax=Phaffia rhodozyma TaxID=264483 RepID=A0A0F7SPS2_PHARH|nr:Pentatricopeptide repeat [Phaffia rhodozyma]
MQYLLSRSFRPSVPLSGRTFHSTPTVLRARYIPNNNQTTRTTASARRQYIAKMRRSDQDGNLYPGSNLQEKPSRFLNAGPQTWPPPKSYSSNRARTTAPLALKGVHSTRDVSSADDLSRLTSAPSARKHQPGKWERTLFDEKSGMAVKPGQPYAQSLQDNGFKKKRNFQGGKSGGAPPWMKDRTIEGGPKSRRTVDDRETRANRTRVFDKDLEQGAYDSPKTLSQYLVSPENTITAEEAVNKVAMAPGSIGKNTVVWNSLLTLMFKRRVAWPRVNQIYSMMLAKGVQPSDRTYTILLSNLPEAPNQSTLVLRAANDIHQSFITASTKDPDGFPPSPAPTNALLKFYRSSKRFDLMQLTFDRMPHRGPASPNAITWVIMFSSLSFQPAKIELARGLWCMLVSRVIEPAQTRARVEAEGTFDAEENTGRGTELNATGMDAKLLATICQVFTESKSDPDIRLAYAIYRAYSHFPGTLSELDDGLAPPSEIPVPMLHSPRDRVPLSESTLEAGFNLLSKLGKPKMILDAYLKLSRTESIKSRTMLNATHLHYALQAAGQVDSIDKLWDSVKAHRGWLPSVIPTILTWVHWMEACAAKKFFDGAARGLKEMTGLRIDLDTPMSVLESTKSFAALSVIDPSVGKKPFGDQANSRLLNAFLSTALDVHADKDLPMEEREDTLRRALRMTLSLHQVTSLEVVDFTPTPLETKTPSFSHSDFLNKGLVDGTSLTIKAKETAKSRMRLSKANAAQITFHQQFLARLMVALDQGLSSDWASQREREDYGWMKKQVEARWRSQPVLVLGIPIQKGQILPTSLPKGLGDDEGNLTKDESNGVEGAEGVEGIEKVLTEVSDLEDHSVDSDRVNNQAL